MAEFALDKDLLGMKKGYKNIEEIEDNALLKQTISPKKLKILSQNIEKLETYINNAEYANVALLSSTMFNDSVTNFKYKNSIKDQLHIEHLDYMGFRLLTFLSTKENNYAQMSQAITDAKINWNLIKGNVKDINSADAFDLLFEGLEQSLKTKNNVIIKILAELDLALVDVVEGIIN